MAIERQKLIHLHTPEVKIPTVGLLEAGEIAVQHNDSEAALYIEKSNGEIAKFIDESAVDAKVAVEKARAEGIEAGLSDKIDALEDSNHTHDNKGVLDGITEEKIAAWDGAEAAAKAYADGLADNYDAAGSAASAEAAAKAYADGLADNYDAAGSAASAEAAAKAYADGLADNYDAAGAAASAEAAAKAYADGLADNYDAAGTAESAIDALDLENTYAAKSVEGVISTLVGSDANKSVRSVAAEEVAKIVNGADESFDTLKEIADWIQSDTTGAAGMAADIDALQAISADTRLDTLEGVSHSHSNKALLDTYTQTEANLADAVAKKHSHDNKGVLDGISEEKVAAWDGAEAAAKAYADGLADNYDAAGAAASAEAAAKAYADGLADNYDAAGAAASAEAAAKAYADGLADNYDAAGSAASAEAAAKAYADGLADNYDAAGSAAAAEAAAKADAEAKYQVKGDYEAAGAAASAEANAKSYTDTAISNLIIDCGTY